MQLLFSIDEKDLKKKKKLTSKIVFSTKTTIIFDNFYNTIWPSHRFFYERFRLKDLNLIGCFFVCTLAPFYAFSNTGGYDTKKYQGCTKYTFHKRVGIRYTYCLISPICDIILQCLILFWKINTSRKLQLTMFSRWKWLLYALY